MRERLGEGVHKDDAANDQGKPNQCRKVQRLPEPEPSNQGDQDDAETGPNGIRNADGDRAQAECENTKDAV